MGYSVSSHTQSRVENAGHREYAVRVTPLIGFYKTRKAQQHSLQGCVKCSVNSKVIKVCGAEGGREVGTWASEGSVGSKCMFTEFCIDHQCIIVKSLHFSLWV